LLQAAALGVVELEDEIDSPQTYRDLKHANISSQLLNQIPSRQE